MSSRNIRFSASFLGLFEGINQVPRMNQLQLTQAHTQGIIPALRSCHIIIASR